MCELTRGVAIVYNGVSRSHSGLGQHIAGKFEQSCEVVKTLQERVSQALVCTSSITKIRFRFRGCGITGVQPADPCQLARQELHAACHI